MKTLYELLSPIFDWWERQTFPQDKEMDKRVKELQEKYRKEKEDKSD